MTPLGMFIVLEGADGSGKSTQFKLTVERLKAIGHDVEVFKFPQYDQPSSTFVRAYLNGEYGPAGEVSPYTASMFYALDRYHAAPRIKQALAGGKVVVADRYVGSNMAHQGSKFTNFAEQRGFFIWEDSLEFELLGIPRPNINIFLRVPVETSLELMGDRPVRTYTNKKLDQHEANDQHLRKTIVTYDLLCKLFPKDFEEIDCAPDGKLLSIVQINDLIWEILKPLLPQPKGQPKGATVKLSDKASHKKAASRPKPKKIESSTPPAAKMPDIYRQALDEITQIRHQIQDFKTVDKMAIKSALDLTRPLDTSFNWLYKKTSESKNRSTAQSDEPMAINKILDEIPAPKKPSGGRAPEIKLLEVIPRNELDILEQGRNGDLTYQQKHAALERQLASGFGKFSYNLSGIFSYRFFKNFLEDGLVIQPKTSFSAVSPGYELPPEIAESPQLEKLFSRCFNLSFGAYSQLLGSGHMVIAPKVLLLGQLNHWRFKLNIQSLSEVLASNKQASGKPDLKLLVDLIAEVHPTVAKALEQHRTSKTSQGSKTAARG